MTYPVHERFLSFQGEGVHMGWPAFFIRLYGCPVHCPWCDSAGTWHPKHVPSNVRKFTASELAEEAANSGARFVVITGGEPAIHDLTELCSRLHAENLKCHLETSGAFPIKGHFDWITLSPKRWRLPLDENLYFANEFKFIIEHEKDVEFYNGVLFDGFDGSPFMNSITNSNAPIWLHPEWSQRNNTKLLKFIVDVVKRGENYRAGYQLHKLYVADRQDMRSEEPVPLGGDPSKGF
jgi:organic radical activating enzyme